LPPFYVKADIVSLESYFLTLAFTPLTDLIHLSLEGGVGLNKSIIDAIEKASEEFKENMKSEIQTSKSDESAIELVEQLARQTYYVFSEISDQLKKL
jgi:hypothetical protein